MPLFEQRGLADPRPTASSTGSTTAMRASTISSPRCRRASARRSARSGRCALEGLEVAQLTGADIEEAHWDAFWAFYQDTGARKWGRPYLTRAFFSLLGERLADRVLLILALRDGAADRRRAQPDRRRRALRPLLGRDRGGAVPPFRALLLSGDRGGDRARPRAGRGRRAGRAQARAAATGRCRPGRRTTSPIRGFRDAVADYPRRRAPRGGAGDRGARRN